MSFQNGLSLVLCYLILMLPMSCRNRVESSGVANIDLESTQGFSGLDEEVQSHALALQRYLNAGLKQTGFQIFDMQDRMVSLKEYDEYKDVDKGRRFYFKLSKLKLENMGMQFFTKIDPVSEILEIKIQSIDVRTKNVISNSEQVLSFDTQKINKIFDKANTNQEIYNQLAGVREKITSSSIASMKYFSSIGHDLLINPVNISLVFVGVASVFILNSVIPNTRKIPLTIFVVSLVVAAGLITYKVIDAKQEAVVRYKFLPINWERNHLLLDEAMLKSDP